MAEPIYFADAKAFREWLSANSDTAHELLVGFIKQKSPHSGLSWAEAVDEALCFGWIDGVRKTVDASRYQIRFSPRKPDSTWSAVNIRRFSALLEEGRITPKGQAGFDCRLEKKSRTYSYEQSETPEFSPAEIKSFQRNKSAWDFFESLAPSYKRKIIWWIISAKQESTRIKRFDSFVQACTEGRKL